MSAPNLDGLPQLPDRPISTLITEMDARYFPLREWQSASDRRLTTTEIRWAWWWTTYVLGPARRALGPILITSYERRTHPDTGEPETGGHRTTDTAGAAVDVVPLADVTTRELRDWIATHRIDYIGELIDEQDHVHMTVRGVGGAGQVLDLIDGAFRPGATRTEAVIGMGTAAALALLLAGLYHWII